MTPDWALDRINAPEQNGGNLNLACGGDPLTEVPPELALLSLWGLSLRGNRLASLDPVLLADLESLELGENDLDEVPSGTFQLTKLKHLDFSGNRLTTIEPSFKALASLEYLDLSGNHLTSVPEFVGELPALRHLDLRGNSIANLPRELYANKPLSSRELRAYFRQLHEEGSDYLCEAKLLIVGEGGAGKTTLARKLLDARYALDPTEDNTEGIDISEWEFPAHIRAGDRGEPHDSLISVHIWDFAGQQITYATHQFFMTARSLYVLLVDNRRENANFDYWLNVVELLSDGSPMLVVKNEKQGVLCSINETAARAQFQNVKDIVSADLANEQAVENLTRLIQGHIQLLPHIGSHLPRTWKRVRQALLEKSRHVSHISKDELLTLCDQHGFKRHEDKLQVAQFLHDLGACVYFQNDPPLANFVILRPTWATRAVYRVLRDRAITLANGRFSKSDINKRLWHEPDLVPVQADLLELMRKFKLCYPLDETGDYLIPQLLPKNQPAYEWKAFGNLQIFYEYEFMPKGLLARAIVSLYRLIEDQSLVWQDGVILNNSEKRPKGELTEGGEEARAEILEDSTKRRISIRVVGKTERQLLGIITNAIEDIHSGYRRLKVRKMIPCRCKSCKTAEAPFFFDVQKVREFARKGRASMQCQDSAEDVQVSALLSTIGESVASAGGDGTLLAPPTLDDIFISYAWGGDSERVAELIEAAFARRGIRVRRDKKELAYKADIDAFMTALSSGARVVLVISDGYLTSPSCMRELVQLAALARARDQLIKRVFPVVLPDAQIFRPADRVRYLKHWEQEWSKLNYAMQGLNQNNLDGFRDDIDLYERIRNEISGLADTLRRLNLCKLVEHETTEFRSLVEAVTAMGAGQA